MIHCIMESMELCLLGLLCLEFSIFEKAGNTQKCKCIVNATYKTQGEEEQKQVKNFGKIHFHVRATLAPSSNTLVFKCNCTYINSNNKQASVNHCN